MIIKQKGFSKGLGVFFLFVLALIPLVFLHQYFIYLANRNENVSEELLKEYLLREMNNFQEDLRPENYIESAFRDLELHFKFPKLNNKNYKFSFGKGYEPDYITKDFISKSKHFLKDKFGIDCLLFISSDYDLKNIVYEVTKPIFKTDSEKERFLYSCLGAMLFHTNENYNFKVVSDENAVSFNKTLKKIVELKGLEYPELSFNNAFAMNFVKSISLFYLSLSVPNKCVSYFSNRLGNQKVYEYYNFLGLKNNDKSLNVLGMYYSLIRNTDINIDKLFELTVRKKSDNKLVNVKRSIIKSNINIPNWELNSNYIAYKIPFPSSLYSYISYYKNENNELYEQYNEFLQNHALLVRIDRSDIKNEFENYYYYTQIVIWSLLIILLLVIINSIFNYYNPIVILSLKVRLIIFIAVIIPIVGFWIISHLTMLNEEKLFISGIQKIITARIDFLEKLNEDFNLKITEEMLELKKNISDHFYSFSNSEGFFKSINNNSYNPLKEKPVIGIDKSYFMDRAGNITSVSPYASLEKTKFTTVSSMYSIMSDLNKLDRDTYANRKNDNQHIFLSSFSDSYQKVYNKKNILAMESFFIPGKSFTNKNKNVYQLISSKENSNKVDMIVLNNIDTKDIVTEFVNEIKSKHPELLECKKELFQIEFNMFQKSELNYQYANILGNYPFNQMHLIALKKAVDGKDSDFDIVKTDTDYRIVFWRTNNDNLIIFSGAAIIPIKSNNIIDTGVLGLLLFIYVILSASLLSDFLSDALLSPVKTLTSFVNEISNGYLNVKAIIDTGDEIEDLGHSFNKMSEGLCEREKLKRFVSDKLVNSLGNGENNTVSKTKVTILNSDIRNFTTISEQNSPEEVVALLNDYFTLMEKAIIKYGGSIEKIIGDAISASFYAEKDSDFALNACLAAIEMRKSLIDFNAKRLKSGKFEIDNGIGLATGDVFVGFAGKKARRKEFLLIGNILKSAEKLEGMTKNATSSRIFVEKATYDLVNDRIKFCENDSSDDSQIFYREIMI